MRKSLRIIIWIAVLVGTVGLAQSRAAWAQPAEDAVYSAGSEAVAPIALQEDANKGGTVKPPPDKARICKVGNYPLGGVAVLRVSRLAPDYCLTASLRKRGKETSGTPAGSILADITNIQFYYQNQPIAALSESNGTVEICYAVPPGRQAQIYFRGNGTNDWIPLATTFTKRTACAPAQVSGSYALIGQ